MSAAKLGAEARPNAIVRAMSFQAYLDDIEAETGKTPAQLVAMAKT
jgi:hypothetical protein